MNWLAYQHSRGVSHRPSQAWTLLVQLSSAHEQLVAEMENLDRITHGAEPELGEITSGRWRISQASRKRRSLACRVFDFLADRPEGLDFATLKSVQSADQELMRRSAAHVGNWTIQKISSDWQGYCEASRHIRIHMRQHMQLERQSFTQSSNSSRSGPANIRLGRPFWAAFPVAIVSTLLDERRPAIFRMAGLHHVRHTPVGFGACIPPYPGHPYRLLDQWSGSVPPWMQYSICLPPAFGEIVTS